MSKYGTLEILVKIFETKTAEPKVKDNGRVFQMMGTPVATIKLGEDVMFEKISGMFGMSYKNEEAFNNDEGQMVVMFNQQFTGDNGQQYDKVIVGEKLSALLQVETMKVFAEEGFAHSERDEHIAENAGISTDEYMNVAKAAMARAAAGKGTIKKTTQATGDALSALDAELAGEIG